MFQQLSNPHLPPAARNAETVKVSHMAQTRSRSEEKNAPHGITNVLNARQKAIMTRHATNARIVISGDTNPRVAGGVMPRGISRPQMMKWALCYQR